jgi:RNA polymerase sigma-70 factor, ECF subfamily
MGDVPMPSEPGAGAFETAVAPHRKELLAHAYQMLGSVHDAEDAVQEAMARAWRAWDRFDPGIGSARTWLHAIVRNTCLTRLSSRQRRVLPSGLGAPGADVEQALVAAPEVAWIEPIPSSMVLAAAGDVAEVAVQRSHVRLAFVVALQVLPPRQRAVLILREVLRFSAAEVAEMIDTTPTAVNSALQRARAVLDQAQVDGGPTAPEPAAAEVLDRYVDAFARADVGALRTLLVDDVVMEMPPVPLWFRGRDDFVGFLERAFRMRGTDWRATAVDANGQTALAAYVRAGEGYEAHSIQVLDIAEGGVTRNVVFFDASLFARFGLPTQLDG